MSSADPNPTVVEKPKQSTCDTVLSWKCPATTGAVYGALNLAYLITLGSEDPLGWTLALLLWVVFPAALLFKFGLVKMPESCCKGESKEMDASKYASIVRETVTRSYNVIVDLLTWKDAMLSAQVFVGLYCTLAVVDYMGFNNVVFLALQLAFVTLPVYSKISKAEVCAEFRAAYDEKMAPVVASAQGKIAAFRQALSKHTAADVLAWKDPKVSGSVLVLANVAVITFTSVACLVFSFTTQALVLIFGASFLVKSLKVSPSACATACSCGDSAEKRLTALLTMASGVPSKISDILLWKAPAETLAVFAGLYIFSCLHAIFGLTLFVLLAMNVYALALLAVQQPVYAEKVQPVVDQVRAQIEARFTKTAKTKDE